MKIAIVNKKDLNNCWSSLQYTDNCHLCEKMEPRKGYLQCRVDSEYHKNGVVRYFKIKHTQIEKTKSDSLKKLREDKEKILNVFKR